MKATQDTRDQTYANYLIENQSSVISVLLQTPYRWHLKALNLGRTLDIGCGAGRNLRSLTRESVGIDHNAMLVASCVERGMNAFTTDAFLSRKGEYFGAFDSILLSHVAEHMTVEQFTGLAREYSQFLKSGGRIFIICPQEKGYESDSTHVVFMTFELISKALTDAGFKIQRRYSFPFPRFVGKFFRNNEFVVVAKKI